MSAKYTVGWSLYVLAVKNVWCMYISINTPPHMLSVIVSKMNQLAVTHAGRAIVEAVAGDG